MEIDRDSSKVLFVGDIHGDLDTVLEVKEMIEDYEKVIFLGDYVDRGEQDIETLIEILKLKLDFPKKVVLLRGNHEDLQMNLFYGFAGRLKMIGFSEWELLQEFYNKLLYIYYNPNLKLIAVHAGPPDFSSKILELKELDDLQKELILWSDFNWDNPNVDFLPSPRGAGILYGKKPLQRFMEINNIDLFVRGHEYFESGYRIYRIDNKLLISIFSSSANGYFFVKKKLLEISEEGYRVLNI